LAEGQRPGAGEECACCQGWVCVGGACGIGVLFPCDDSPVRRERAWARVSAAINNTPLAALQMLGRLVAEEAHALIVRGLCAESLRIVQGRCET
jgi:hypothetical protein